LLKSVLASVALCAGLGATAVFADASALDKFTPRRRS
jgi:hypothetical protein